MDNNSKKSEKNIDITEKEEEITLDQLPTELINLILKFLDRENKKKLRLVNDRFDNLVVNLDKSFMLWTVKTHPFSEKENFIYFPKDSKPGSVDPDSLIEDLHVMTHIKCVSGTCTGMG